MHSRLSYFRNQILNTFIHDLTSGLLLQRDRKALKTGMFKNPEGEKGDQKK